MHVANETKDTKEAGNSKDAIRKDDFIELEYTAMIKDSGLVFDTTQKDVAQEHGIDDSKTKYGPVTICVGEGQLLAGLDHRMIGLSIGKHSIELSPEEAFGKKDAKLIQLINTQKFFKQGVAPQPGLQVNIDNMIGVVRTVSGGRTIVDFNHPLSGKDVRYEINILRRVVDDMEKARAYLSLMFGDGVEVASDGDTLKVTLKRRMPEPIEAQLREKLRKHVQFKVIEFVQKDDAKGVSKQEGSLATLKVDKKIDAQEHGAHDKHDHSHAHGDHPHHDHAHHGHNHDGHGHDDHAHDSHAHHASGTQGGAK